MMKLIALVLFMLGLAACNQDKATVVSHNLSKSADNFEVYRRTVFYNIEHDTYILEIKGWCNVEFETEKTVVTCKAGPDQYLKHYLRKSRDVTAFIEQVGGVDASEYHYRVSFRPDIILPDVRMDSKVLGQHDLGLE